MWQPIFISYHVLILMENFCRPYQKQVLSFHSIFCVTSQQEDNFELYILLFALQKNNMFFLNMLFLNSFALFHILSPSHILSTSGYDCPKPKDWLIGSHWQSRGEISNEIFLIAQVIANTDGHILIDVQQKTVLNYDYSVPKYPGSRLIIFFSQTQPIVRNLASKTLNHNLATPGKNTQASEVFFEHEKDK